MRLLILLTFILYETQCAPSIKPLKILKSLFETQFSAPIVKHPIFETEIYPIENCEDDAKDEIIVELNPELFENNNRPVIVEIENSKTNPHIIPVEIHVENPEANTKINDASANNEEKVEVIPEMNDEESVKKNPEENINVNPEEADKIEKIDENTSEKQPAVTDGINHSKIPHDEISIKEKIKAKIELIRSILKSRHYPTGQVPEISTQDSTYLFEEGDDIHVISTTQQPSTTTEPITTTLKPTTTEEYTTAPDVTTPTMIEVTTMKPVTTTESVSQPPCVQVNNDNACDEVVINIPDNTHRPHKVYLSPTTYQLFFLNCPSPWAPERCFRPNHHYVPNPIYPNKLAATPINLADVGYYGPNFGTYKGVFGVPKVVDFKNNNFNEVGLNRPINPIVRPAQNEGSWNRYTNGNVNPTIPPNYPVSSSVLPQTVMPAQPVSPTSGVLYSTSTPPPTTVYPDEISAPLQRDQQTDLIEPEDQQRAMKTISGNQWTQYSGPVPDLIDAQDYPQQKSRGDILYEPPQDQGDEYTYPMKNRRHVRSNDDEHLFIQNDDVKLFDPPKITPVEIPVNEIETKNESKAEKMVAVKSQSEIVDSAMEE